MTTISKNPYLDAFNANNTKMQEKINSAEKSPNTSDFKKEINRDSVNLSISVESMKVLLTVRGAEFTKGNTLVQDFLTNLESNKELFDFLSGKEGENGFNLTSTGYEGKAITELNPEEATALVSEDGFFGINNTSDRVSSFVFAMAGDNVDYLKESRKGLVQGFDEAEKLWGGKLPDISYVTQERTLKLVDEKIAELSKVDNEE